MKIGENGTIVNAAVWKLDILSSVKISRLNWFGHVNVDVKSSI